MQQRNVRGARGVQIEEVCSAADEILARGERPTIERVRLQLGRGSPNTVGPMLESWYATLGKRLQPASEATQQEGGGGTELPPPVIRAAKALWGRALQLASEQATEEVAATMLALEGKAESLRQEEERLRQEEQRINDRSNALELAVIAKDQQISDLGRQLQETQQRFVEHTESIAELRAEAMKLRHAADAERRSKEQRDEEHRKERERLAEQAVANEKRLLAEVDRARQEAKKLQQQIEADARTSAKALADGQEKLRSTSLRLDC